MEPTRWWVEGELPGDAWEWSRPRVLGDALRYCGGRTPTHPGKYGFVGAEVTPEHFCELDGPAVEEAQRLGAGGLLECLVCGTPIFVPPLTCLGRVEEEIDGGVFHADQLLRDRARRGDS